MRLNYSIIKLRGAHIKSHAAIYIGRSDKVNDNSEKEEETQRETKKLYVEPTEENH